MYRIINSLATAEFNKRLRAVEVKFKGWGDSELYHDTMDIAMNIALIYSTNSWFFVKDTFEDINEHKFLYFVRKWSNRAHELFSGDAKNHVCKVALLTTPNSKELLLKNHLWITDPQRKFQTLLLKIFTDKEEACEFLIGQPNKMLSI